jgi:hypothetical protein
MKARHLIDDAKLLMLLGTTSLLTVAIIRRTSSLLVSGWQTRSYRLPAKTAGMSKRSRTVHCKRWRCAIGSGRATM